MSKNLTLPSGKIATIKDGKGIDLLHAQMKAKSSEEIPYALIAELTEIDGQVLVYEDILELDLSDVIELQTAISGKVVSEKKEVKKQESKTEPSLTKSQTV